MADPSSEVLLIHFFVNTYPIFLNFRLVIMNHEIYRNSTKLFMNQVRETVRGVAIIFEKGVDFFINFKKDSLVLILFYIFILL